MPKYIVGRLGPGYTKEVICNYYFPMKKTPLFLTLLGLVALVVLFVYLKPKPAATNTTSTVANVPTTATATNTTANTNTNPVKSFTLVVKDRKLVTGPDTLTVSQNDQVHITITVDEAEELHLHGYDQSVEVVANQPASLTFTASITGRFEYELEESGTAIGALEVQPK